MYGRIADFAEGLITQDLVRALETELASETRA